MSTMTMSKRQAEGLCEVVHDISVNLYCHLNSMEDGERDRMMDALHGSRGLFWDHVLVWAREYQNSWEALSDAERDAKDYLNDIDTFTREKFITLKEHHIRLHDVVSIQVVPVIHYPARDDQNEHSEAQPGGPTADTSCWGVYTRCSQGLATWVADCTDEATAMLLGAGLAAEHGVEIEPQVWKEKPSEAPELPRKEYRVQWEIDLEATSPRDAALSAQSVQRDVSYPSGQYTVTPFLGGEAVSIDLDEDK